MENRIIGSGEKSRTPAKFVLNLKEALETCKCVNGLPRCAKNSSHKRVLMLDIPLRVNCNVVCKDRERNEYLK